MENKTNSKKTNVFQIILCIAVMALVVTVIIQSRNINSIKKSDNDVTTENVAMETITKNEAASEPISAPVEIVKTATVESIGTIAKKQILTISMNLNINWTRLKRNWTWLMNN